MTDEIRRLCRNKKRYYILHGRNMVWRRKNARVRKLIKQAKTKYFDKIKRRLTEDKNSRGYYRAARILSCHEMTKPWKIQHLYPGVSDPLIAEECASFFNGISQDFDPLNPIGGGVESLEHLCPELYEVATRLKYMKKPKSIVPGDIDPRLVTKFADLLAVPVHQVFKKVYATQQWPQLWGSETVTLIPKVPLPGSLSQLRNISCTPLLSKCLESFILKDLQKNISLRPTQFGGIKGVGVDHFLVDAWNDILTSLEDPRACVNLMSIDFKKAFNTMCHKNCLVSLKRLGASEAQCRLVAAFLRNRIMRVKVGDSLSQPRLVPGGAPQGSVLGSFLFCAATDMLGTDLTGRQVLDVRSDCHSISFQNNGVDVSNLSGSDISDPPSPIGPPRAQLQHLSSDESDDEFTCFRQGRPGRFVLNDTELSFRWTADEMARYWGKPEDWHDPGLKVKVYIDINSIEKICCTNSVCAISQEKKRVLAHAQHCELNFKAVKSAAEKVGMSVNDAKTQLLCISGNKDIDVNTYIRTSDTAEVQGGDRMKLLGFWFGRKPNADVHVEEMCSKFRSRLWALRHLKRAGMAEADLLKIYETVIRLVLDFVCATYHPLLSKTQSLQI